MLPIVVERGARLPTAAIGSATYADDGCRGDVVGAMMSPAMRRFTLFAIVARYYVSDDSVYDVIDGISSHVAGC